MIYCDHKFIKFIVQVFLLVVISLSLVFSQSHKESSIFCLKEDKLLLPDFFDSYGVVFRDINKDQLPDIYVVRFRNLNRLFINQGNSQPFMDYTIHSGLGGNLMPRGQENLELGASSADFDKDGLPDFIVTGWGISTELYQQRKGLTFENVTRHLNVNSPLDANGGFWADIDLDGDLDLFITDEHFPNRLYIGDGRGNFTERSHSWGVDQNEVSQGAGFSDIDLDGHPDLYVCNWFAPDFLYRNTGLDSFEMQNLSLTHLTDSLNSNGISFGDIDNDGDPDLLVTDRNGHSALYRNDIKTGVPGWKFTEITDSAGLIIPYPAYGSIIADLNNDGWQDVWINCIGPNLCFMNNGTGKLQKVYETTLRSQDPKNNYSTGAAVADIDIDGDLDLFVSNKDTNSVLFINSTDNNHFIKFKLTGVESNKDALGAKIWLYQSGDNGGSIFLCGYREISGGGGYLSQNSPVVHFGVEPQYHYTAKIVFPAGKELTLSDLSAGQLYEVSEYQGLLRIIFESQNYTVRLISRSDFWLRLLLFFLLVLLLVGYSNFSMNRYHWEAKQIILFFSLAIIILYGIFFMMQAYSVQARLVIQLLVLSGSIVLITFFMEKIRRLEIVRLEYRKLLQDFSRDLILIKNNEELYKKLVSTIHQSVKPKYCSIYIPKGNIIYKYVNAGLDEGPDRIELNGNLKINSLQKSEDFLSRIKIPDLETGYIFPIIRSNNLFGLLVIGPSTGKTDFNPGDLSVFRNLAAQAAITTENNNYIEETRQLIQQITESETRDKYLNELENANRALEEKNKKLEQLFSDLKNTQSQLVQSEKMASLGQLMAGIAHELNNPISFIYANTKELDRYAKVIRNILEPIIRSKADPGAIVNQIKKLHQKEDLDYIIDDLNTLVQESQKGSLRVKELVQNLRNFSRIDEAERKEVDLCDGLDSTLLLLNNEIKGRIRIHKDYRKIPLVECNAGQINQVFMNILMNAVQAIDKKGNIWISVAKINNQVEVLIRDDGKGMVKAIVSKIFDPFFTTKPVGKGTGLGLSISYDIIRKHGGNIQVESEKNRGSSFKIILPII